MTCQKGTFPIHLGIELRKLIGSVLFFVIVTRLFTPHCVLSGERDAACGGHQRHE